VAIDEPPLTSYSVPNYPPPAPRLSVLQIVQRSLPIVLLPVVALVAGALVYGLLRPPVYTSEARLNVGGLNLTQQSIDGYTHAVAQLAVSYSRAIDATGVVGPVARETGLSRGEVADRVSATPVEGSPVIRVRGTSGDAAEAERLADASATSLVEYAFELNSGTEQSKKLLRRYVAASKEYREARLAVARLDVSDPRRRDAHVQEDIARLEQQTAGALYQQSLAGQATTNLVQRLAPAAPATSDRAEVLQQFVAGALIAGLLIGVGLAVARGNRLTLRRLGAR
jgi:uncharacterized protein involved in exopolysaccharide biosynthesis